MEPFPKKQQRRRILLRRRVFNRSGQFTEECESRQVRCRCKGHCQVDSLLLVPGGEAVGRGAGQGAEAEPAWRDAEAEAACRDAGAAAEPVWRVAEPVERRGEEPGRRQRDCPGRADDSRQRVSVRDGRCRDEDLAPLPGC